jgi:hypothetical protein
MVQGMDPTIADSAHQLQRAAESLQRHASDPAAVAALPAALAHLEEALERLSTTAVTAAQAVEDWALETDGGTLSPSARALRWHLFHLSARLRSARDGCPATRDWARELLDETAVPN